MPHPIRVVQYGLGPIGLATARVLLKKHATGHVQLVGAVDIDSAKAGRDLADLTDQPQPTGVVVTDDIEQCLRTTYPDVVLHTTSSFLDRVEDQVLRCVEAGAHVISSTEELAYPFVRHPERSARLDEAARRNGVVILGTGVNPGYAMDTLVLAATGACTDVERIRVERVVDAGRRREPLQRKVGAGLSVAAFEEKKRTGTFGHIGLRESLLLVADGMGWQFEEMVETLDPVIATRAVTTPFLAVEADEVAGIHHAITGYRDGEALLSLDLKMYVGANEPRDAIHVEGTPPIDLVIRGGIFGDTATVAALVNAIPLVFEVQPGLRTTKDFPVPRCFASSPVCTPVSGTS